MEAALTALTAAVFTLLEIDLTFHVPKRIGQRLRLRLLVGLFVSVNAALAVGLYRLVHDSQELAALDPALRALVVGGVYVGLVRFKLATIPYQGREIPFGFELLYDMARSALYKRINHIALEARLEQTLEYAQTRHLDELARDAKFIVTHDPLLTEDERTTRLDWILETVEDADSLEDFDARAAIADFLLSGEAPLSSATRTRAAMDPGTGP